MANTTSAQKCIRQMATRAERNRQVLSELKTLSKKAYALAAENAPEAKQAAQAYISALDKAAKRNIIHFNKASRHKKSLAKQVFASA